MYWVAVMTLADGTRVESSLPTIDEPATSLGTGIYRVLLPDGSVTVLETMAEVLGHLRGHLEPIGPGSDVARPPPGGRSGARP